MLAARPAIAVGQRVRLTGKRFRLQTLRFSTLNLATLHPELYSALNPAGPGSGGITSSPHCYSFFCSKRDHYFSGINTCVWRVLP